MLTMAEDLYHAWLSVSTQGREANATPNAYDLLCMPRFCHHKSAAEEAARRQMEKLDKFSITPDSQKRDMASRMMNEVAQARLIVTEEKRYQQYDPKLAQQLGVAVPTEEVAAPPDLIPIGEGGTRLDMGDAASAPVDQGDMQRLDKSLIGSDVPEIKAEADLTAPREKGVSDVVPIPILIGGGVVIVALVIAVVMLLSSDTKDQTADWPGDAPPALTPGARVVADRPAGGAAQQPVVAVPDTLDEYDRPLLGRDRYEEQASDTAKATIENGKLVLLVPGEEEGDVRLKFTPSDDARPIERMSCEVTLDGEQSMLSIAISTGGLRLVLTRSGQIIRVESSPGLPAGDSWLEFDASKKGLFIQVERQESKVVWKVNNESVAICPQIPPRGTPNVLFSLRAFSGAKATIDNLTIYRQDLSEQ